MKSLDDKVGQMFVVGFQGLKAPDYILNWLSEGKISGVLLYAGNVENPLQLASLCQSVHRAAKYPALIAIDQEGGTVANLRENKGFTESPGALALASAQDTAMQTETVSAVLGNEMRSLGINWNYAPSVDITYNLANPTVGTRSFGGDKEVVSQLAAAAVRGFQGSGVAACAKHFPGLGNTSIDTHLALATLDTDLDHLMENDLLPYRAAIKAGLASMMTTHTFFPALDETYPATLSPTIIQSLIREELAFEGIAVSDCMEMRAISDNYDPGESATLGVLAGLDVVLISHTRSTQEVAYQAMLDAARSGQIPMGIIDRANARIEQFKAKYKITPSEITANSIGHANNQQIALAAARTGITLVRQNNDLLPLPESGNATIGLVEFVSHLESDKVEHNEQSDFADLLLQKRPDIEVIALNGSAPSAELTAQAEKIASRVDILLLATRNAHIFSSQQNVAMELLKRAENCILLPLRNPYDIEVLTADVVICSNGDSSPSLAAIVETLQGAFRPSGK